jgi:hypothetical protein
MADSQRLTGSAHYRLRAFKPACRQLLSIANLRRTALAGLTRVLLLERILIRIDTEWIEAVVQILLVAAHPAEPALFHLRTEIQEAAIRLAAQQLRATVVIGVRHDEQISCANPHGQIEPPLNGGQAAFPKMLRTLGPVDKPVLAPAQPERLGRCNTEVATG